MHLRSDGFFGRVIPAMLLCALSATGAMAQAAAAAGGSGQRGAGQQPGLTVDRDPVASPDPDPPRAECDGASARGGSGKDRDARAGSTRCGRMRMRSG